MAESAYGATGGPAGPGGYGADGRPSAGSPEDSSRDDVIDADFEEVRRAS